MYIKSFLFSSLLLFSTVQAKFCPRTDVEPDAGCKLDLTLAVDYSIAMKSKNNVYEVGFGWT